MAFSGATVAACLCTLLVFPIPLVRSIACGGVVVVLASAAGALVLVPALLLLLGERANRWDVFARLRPKASEHARTGVRGGWFRVAQWVTRRPVTVLLGVLVLLGLLAAPSALARFGLYGDRHLPSSSPVAQTSRELRNAFGTTASGTPSVVLPGLDGRRSAAAVNGYARRLSRVPGVHQVDTLTGAYRLGRQSHLPPAKAVRFISDAGTWLSIVPETGNALTPEGSRLAERLRRVPAPVPPLVGGLGAQLADTEAALTSRLPLVGALTAGATFLILLVFTGSVLIPVKALLLNALSLTATFGILVAVFQEGWLTGLPFGVPAAGVTDVIAPLMFAVAFGLSMDYEVFLLSRIVEEYRRGSPTPVAVATGLQHSGRLFTAAAFVFAIVMAALALSDLLHLRMVGTSLAVAVLLDCTIVRVLLVPAAMQLAGRANWWLPKMRTQVREPVASHP
ncbi:MMPL family transporter [Streptomyces sirii]|uniref:MMPL family transporter n=1 Tax=Streptomyces sirii TaxID=3127701 RepID=UPI003D35F934